MTRAEGRVLYAASRDLGSCASDACPSPCPPRRLEPGAPCPFSSRDRVEAEAATPRPVAHLQDGSAAGRSRAPLSALLMLGAIAFLPNSIAFAVVIVSFLWAFASDPRLA